jgi:2-polyprenyl-3-methyl-5-hydroxy-6-metoxy-1,4-benzoquinol methylase
MITDLSKYQDIKYYDEAAIKKGDEILINEVSRFSIVTGLLALFDRQLHILDIGCGAGHLFKWLHSTGFKNYTGIDFSPQMISQAKKFYPDQQFVIANLIDFDFSYWDAFTMLEVLEHIKDDIALIKSIPSGKLIIITVPNTTDIAHVRVFESVAMVIERYEKYIDFDFTGVMKRNWNDRRPGLNKVFFVFRGIKK